MSQLRKYSRNVCYYCSGVTIRSTAMFSAQPELTRNAKKGCFFFVSFFFKADSFILRNGKEALKQYPFSWNLSHRTLLISPAFIFLSTYWLSQVQHSPLDLQLKKYQAASISAGLVPKISLLRSWVRSETWSERPPELSETPSWQIGAVGTERSRASTLCSRMFANGCYRCTELIAVLAVQCRRANVKMLASVRQLYSLC